jgi:exonuclease III
MMDPPVLAGVRLPHFSFVSQNLNSLSAYPTSRAGLARRDNILANIKHFSLNYNIICLQETHLSLPDSNTLKGFPALRSHSILYGNGDGRAGVITALSRAVTDHYMVTEPPVPVELSGHALALESLRIIRNKVAYYTQQLRIICNSCVL